MAHLISISFDKIKDPHSACLICLEKAQEKEGRYKKLSYLDLATQPRYIIHPYGANNQSAFSHVECISEWIKRSLSKGEIPTCLHCNQKIGFLDGRALRIINPAPTEFVAASFTTNRLIINSISENIPMNLIATLIIGLAFYYLFQPYLK